MLGLPIQWNLSAKDTIGTSRSVHNIEVSLFQRLISTAMYYIGTSRSVPIMEVSLFQIVLITEVPLYMYMSQYHVMVHTRARAPGMR